MIIINGNFFNWEEGMTIANFLELKKYTYPKVIVKLNGNIIPKNKYTSTNIKDEDDIQVIYLLAGG